MTPEEIAKMDSVSGLSSNEISQMDALFTNKPQDGVPKLPTNPQSLVSKVANALPFVGGLVGGAAGTVGGTVLLPGGGTIGGLAFGTGAGAGAGEAIKQSILNLTGENKPANIPQSFSERMTPKAILESPQINSAITGPTAGLEAYVTGKAFEGLSKIPKSLNFTKNWAAKATQAAEGQPFDKTKYLDDVLKQAEKYSGKAKDAFVRQAIAEGNITANDAAEALTIRRNISKAPWMKKFIFGESAKDTFNAAKYSALNEQLKAIPDVAKYDHYIATFLKVRNILGPIVAAELIRRTGAPKPIVDIVSSP